MTRQQWYHHLLAAARDSYELGECSLREYERGTLALVREHERETRVRRQQAQEIRRQRREEATMTYHGLRARVENARYARSRRGRYEAAIAATPPWSEERGAVEAEFDAEIDRQIDEARDRVDEDDERGGRR